MSLYLDVDGDVKQNCPPKCVSDMKIILSIIF